MTSRTGRLRLRGAKPRGEVAGEGPWSCGGSLRSRHRLGGPWHTPTCTGRARALLCRAGRPLGAGAWPGLRNPPYLGCWASSAGCPRPRPCPSPSGTCYPWCQRQSGPYGRLPGRGRRPSSSLSPLGQHEACGLPGASVAGPAVGGGGRRVSPTSGLGRAGLPAPESVPGRRCGLGVWRAGGPCLDAGAAEAGAESCSPGPGTKVCPLPQCPGGVARWWFRVSRAGGSEQPRVGSLSSAQLWATRGAGCGGLPPVGLPGVPWTVELARGLPSRPRVPACAVGPWEPVCCLWAPLPCQVLPRDWAPGPAQLALLICRSC